MGTIDYRGDGVGERYNNQRKAEEARISRLEQILGGKSRRTSNRAAEDMTVGHGISEKANIGGEEKAQISGEVYCNHIGLEISMKQLMEATHDALVDMKAEILRMQYDLERALVEISLLRQHKELFQHQFKDKALGLERELMGRIDGIQQSMILQFTLYKQENEQIILSRLESLLHQMKEIQMCSADRVDGSLEKFLKQHLSISRHTSNWELDCNYIAEGSRAKSNIPQISVGRGGQNTSLKEDMLQRISHRRLDRSLATVRRWLQSPTPSDSSAANAEAEESGNCQRRLSTLPIQNSGDPLKEAKLYVTHRRAFSLPSLNASELPFETPQLGLMYPAVTDSINLSDSQGGLASKFCHQPCHQEKKTASPVSVLDGTAHEFKEPHSDITRSPVAPINTWTVPTIQKKQNSILDCYSPSVPRSNSPSQVVSHMENRSTHLLSSKQEKVPSLRILKRENLKISDLLISDSEEELTS